MRTMQGEFLPQSPEYLESDEGPARTLLRAFGEVLQRQLGPGAEGASISRWADGLPPVVFLSAQRWGSALPAPVLTDGRDENGFSPESTVSRIEGQFESAQRLRLVPVDASQSNPPTYTTETEGLEGLGSMKEDFIKDADLKLWFAGDFCSMRVPGVETAALSALHAAKSMSRVLGGCDEPSMKKTTQDVFP